MQTAEPCPHFPEGFEQALHLTRFEMENHLLLMAALKLFELGKVSLGKAAELARMPRTEFLEACGRYHVGVFNLAEESYEAELRSDQEVAEGALGR